MQINTAVFTKTTIVMVNLTALMPVMRVNYAVSVPVSLFLIRLVYQTVWNLFRLINGFVGPWKLPSMKVLLQPNTIIV